MGQKPEILRRQVRRTFTVTCNELKELAVNYSDQFELNKLKTLMISLEDKAKRLFEFDAKISASFDDDVLEEVIEKEFDSTEKYRDELFEAQVLFQSRINLIEKLDAPDGLDRDVDRMSVHSHGASADCLTKKYRYPKLEFLKFDGKAKNWIGFWGLFRRVHEDSSLDKTEKFQLLLQQMVPDSDAWRLVKSYPPSGDNYEKAIEQLKSRFARDEVLIEVYVRELLQLVLEQSRNGKKTPLGALYDKLVSQIRALESLGVTTEKFAAMLYPLVESAIPNDTLLAWERSRVTSSMRDSRSSEANSLEGSESNPLELLLNFLKLEVEHEERLNLARSGFVGEPDISREPVNNTPSATALVSTSVPYRSREGATARDRKETNDCIFCDLSNHPSSECGTAMDMSLKEKNEIVKKKGACFRCLRKFHMSSKCRSFIKCVLCRKGHHSIMCELTESLPNREEKQSTETKALFTQDCGNTTYLQTLVAKIISHDQEYRVRVLLDSGSQKSYILKKLAREFKLKRHGKILVRQELFGGQKTAVKSHDKFELTLQSMTEPFQCTLEVLDQDTICGFVPKVTDARIVSMLERKGIVLSDASCESPEMDEVQLLLGADAWPILAMNETVKLDERMVAVKTALGWTVIGSAGREEGVVPALLNTLTCQANIAHFWDLELLGIEDPGAKMVQAEKDQEVEEFFIKTIERNEEGRYTVQIPWIPGVPNLEDNKCVAMKRLISTTDKLRSTNRFTEYDNVIKLWLELGIVEKVPELEVEESAFYLPHRAVIKELSSTPLRPVFDASSIDRNGRCLNSCIEKGPNLIALIVDVLVNFRLFSKALTADIEKAFLQILIHKKDRNWLRFLWWSGDEVVMLRHCRVVFGVSSSPYLLCAVLRYHLRNAPENLQATATRLERGFYVDNLLTGADSAEELDILKQEAHSWMSSAGFNLRGWVSNAWDMDKNEMVLGLIWTSKLDELSCSSKNFKDSPSTLTRRSLLSIAQRIYDPLGFVTPASLVPRMLLQSSWTKKQSWDEPLTENNQQEFERWFSQITSLEECKISRHIPLNNSSTVHVFCDASKKAFASCIFVRTEIEEEVVVSLLISKSRVSPLKELTLPRLELMAALVGVRLYNEAVKNTSLAHCKSFFWTDASVVISWIARETQWSVFVDNRVREIRKTCNTWRHVPGEMNPADLLSRGCTPDQLKTSRWWEGPLWLHLSPSDWPRSDEVPDNEEVLKEIRGSAIVAVVTELPFSEIAGLIERCGKYSIIVRTVARVLDAACIICPGFAKYCGLDENLIMSREIGGEKFLNAETVIFRMVQQEYFTEEVQKTALKNIHTYFDDRGLLRMKTRILNEELHPDFKCPIILPGKHPLVKKLIAHEHHLNKHAGALTLMTILRERFWIFKYRRSVNSIVKKCVVCRRHGAKPLTAPEPSLPLHRTSAEAVFQFTGVDLAGPLFLATGEKCWVILFTCCVYRAVHLDLLLSLSTEALIQALRRFIARKGRPKIVQSDNGTNFTGLDNLFGQLDWAAIQEECGLQRIQWKFNPPSAAWWGGYWERLVRILKDLLKRNLGQASLLQDEMYTLLCECEAIMNNRPLTYISEDPNELVPLQPSSFLISLTKSDVDDLDQIEEQTLDKRYKYLQTVRQGLRSRFTKEYLAFLRTARKAPEDSVQVGEVFLIGNEKKRIFWPLGRVIELLPGPDGVVRLVKLWTARGELTRPIQKLYPLEVSLSQCPNLPTDVPPQEAESQMGIPCTVSNLDGNERIYGSAEDQQEQLPSADTGFVIDLTEDGPTSEDGRMTIQEPAATTTRSGRQVKIRKILDL